MCARVRPDRRRRPHRSPRFQAVGHGGQNDDLGQSAQNEAIVRGTAVARLQTAFERSVDNWLEARKDMTATAHVQSHRGFWQRCCAVTAVGRLSS